MKILKVTDEVFLKEIEVSDAPALFCIIDSERTSLREYLPFIDYTHKIEDTENFIRSVENGGVNGLNTVYVIKHRDKTAGIIGYKDADQANKRTELGYWLSGNYRGKGLITLSCKVLMQQAFEKMDMNRVQLKTSVDNHKSIAVAKRIGFTLEGREREGELLVNGFTDLLLYSILKRDWNMQQ